MLKAQHDTLIRLLSDNEDWLASEGMCIMDSERLQWMDNGMPLGAICRPTS
jgi:hypothetical protein